MTLPLIIQPYRNIQFYYLLFHLHKMADEDESYRQYEVKEGIVFLIDLSADIFKPILELNKESQLMEILKCVNDLMAEMVMTFPKNGVGIYLYNSTETGKKFPKNSGLTKIFSLNDLNSSNMKILSHIIRDEADGFQPLVKRFSFEDERKDNLHTILKTVLREFQVKPQYNVKKLFWMTNSDKPYVNPALKDSLRTLISDFEDNKIYITPIFLDVFVDETQHERKPFDNSLFQHIFLNTNYLKNTASDEENPFDDNSSASWLRTTFSSQIRQAIFRLTEVRRIQFACDLVLSDGAEVGGNLGCSIKGYTLYNHERIKPFRQVYTEGDGLRLVHNDTNFHRNDTHEVVESRDAEQKPNLVKGFPVKLTNNEEELEGQPNEKILYFKDEVLEYMKGYSFDHAPGSEGKDEKNGKNGDDDSGDEEEDEKEEEDNEEDEENDANKVTFSKPPYLKLLCFRDIDKFQPYFNMKPSVFVTADLSDGLNSSSKEGGYTKSLLTFRSLYQSCIKLKRFALLFGCIKRNSTPDLFALYPTNTSNSTAGPSARQLPDGFLLINIPWLSEIRSLPDYMLTESQRYFMPESGLSGSPELVNLFKKLIDQIGVEEYVPSDKSNPVLNFFYKIIKHEALQIDIKDEDQTLEQNDWTIAKLKELRDTATSNVDVKELILFINLFLNKVSNMEAVKRTAEENRSPNKRAKPDSLSEAAVITLWKEDLWKQATVAQLKEFIGRYDKIKSATRKADMVANISEFLESRKRKE